MLSATGRHGLISSPHHLASRAGFSILRKGGNAVEAAVATAAALGVVYPHMTGLGGDGFWLILPGGRTPGAPGTPPGPVVIDACGASARMASLAWYRQQGLNALPRRGPLAALTMAGAVSGWEAALALARSWEPQGLSAAPLSLGALFETAVTLARQGFPVSASQSAMTREFLPGLSVAPGFTDAFLIHGSLPAPEDRMRLPALATALERLASEGLASFYHGSLAKLMAEDLEAAGSPLRLADFHSHTAEYRSALRLRLHDAVLYNTPPPTQGMASLIILGLTERFAAQYGMSFDHPATLIHAVAEATKQAFLIRDRALADPAHMAEPAESFLRPALLDDLAARIRPDAALPWPLANAGGDTVWLGAMDAWGNCVSYIQSVYHEFGSGMVLPQTGIVWQNRGLGFAFVPESDHPNALAPRKKPLHTLNPAMAVMDDGRVMAYGSMGGDGQPQTQAALFLRHIRLGMPLKDAIAAPRWLLGRSWGDQSASLKLEADVPPQTFSALAAMGHAVEPVPAKNNLMGHAGALVRHPDGRLEGAADPRSNGAALGW